MDLAEAHVKAVQRLVSGEKGTAFNVGTGRGTSVLEILSAIEMISGRQVPHVMADPRAGDAPQLVADNAKMATELGFVPRRTSEEIIATAWRWHVDVAPQTV